MHLDALLIVAIGLGLLHFGFPLVYFYYLKKLWLNKLWDVRSDPEYKPRVSIIVPTYNEAKLVRQKLDDIASQDYPKNLAEIIIVDSASTDGTLEVVKEWIADHRDIRAKLIQENVRRGKSFAINNALRLATGDIMYEGANCSSE
ncbi:MAG: glycosyltransferase [Desulfurococcaceae archaeon]